MFLVKKCERGGFSVNVTELRDGEVLLPKRAAETHKGDYGRLLILGGCVGYTGAPTLCARAAVRSGAGLVYLGVPAPIYDITAMKNDEAMPFPLPADEAGGLSEKAVDIIESRLQNCDVCAVGPGMGKSAGTAAAVRCVLERFHGPVVLDADGLNVLAGHLDWLKAHDGPVILTPHDGEYARLGGVIGADRAESALRFVEEHGCILVLKGHRTVVAYPNGEVYITTHGNPGMAKGGSGDVLTGVIAALLGQLPAERAVPTAVYLHSYAGDLCANALGEYAMTANDIIGALIMATQKMIKE